MIFELLPNTSFSKVLPLLQTAVDSHSLGLFKECERKYFYSVVLGLQPPSRSIHLTFGLLVHGARETYFRERAKGSDHEAALIACVHWCLVATWDKKLRRPWTPVHKDATKKNRLTLVRTMVWYLDKYQNDGTETVLLADGKPAVELKFVIDSGLKSRLTGETFLICGYIDRLLRRFGKAWVDDCKTTKHTLDREWFKQFAPHNQFSTYSFASKIAFNVKAEGLYVDGIQVAVTFSDFMRAEVELDDAQLEEWHRATGRWFRRIEENVDAAMDILYPHGNPHTAIVLDAEAAYPMNETSCDKWGGCEFREVCKRTPRARPQWIAANYQRRKWDPLESRGDI